VSAVLDIIGGLDAAQAAGILHRDIKPSNCFIDSDGSVKVGDFGLSISTLGRDVHEQLATGFEGTPQFAAPEQLRGEPLDVRADIYAVGHALLRSRAAALRRARSARAGRSREQRAAEVAAYAKRFHRGWPR
jgi:serine/threonine protein kinase